MEASITLPLSYRGYKIDYGYGKKYQFIHEDYDGPEDKRVGDRDDLQQCMLDIDDQVIERQAKEIERRKWISVNDRLPFDGAIVLVSTFDFDMVICRYKKTHVMPFVVPYRKDLNVSEVTHWMPLTKPPES